MSRAEVEHLFRLRELCAGHKLLVAELSALSGDGIELLADWIAATKRALRA